MTALVEAVESVKLNGLTNVRLDSEYFTSEEKPPGPPTELAALGVGVL
jgi:hypothetical protein